QGALERIEIGLVELETAAVVRRDRRRAALDVKRRALLRARLRDEQLAGLEADAKCSLTRGRSGRRLPPLQAPGDHQVQHERELLLELNHDALAEPRYAFDAKPDDRVDRRLGRAQQERARQPDVRDAAAEDALAKRLDIDRDVGQPRPSPIARPWRSRAAPPCRSP